MKHSTAIIPLTLTVYGTSFGEAGCFMSKWVATGCPQLHVWHYLPFGIFLASIALLLLRLVKLPEDSVGLQYGVITAGYFAALSARAVNDPVVYHAFRESARIDVGLALFLLLLVPLSNSRCGTVLTFISGALMLRHLLG